MAECSVFEAEVPFVSPLPTSPFLFITHSLRSQEPYDSLKPSLCHPQASLPFSWCLSPVFCSGLDVPTSSSPEPGNVSPWRKSAGTFPEPQLWPRLCSWPPPWACQSLGLESGQGFPFPVITWSSLPKSKGRAHRLPPHCPQLPGQEMCEAVCTATTRVVLRGGSGLASCFSHALAKDL